MSINQNNREAVTRAIDCLSFLERRTSEDVPIFWKRGVRRSVARNRARPRKRETCRRRKGAFEVYRFAPADMRTQSYDSAIFLSFTWRKGGRRAQLIHFRGRFLSGGVIRKSRQVEKSKARRKYALRNRRVSFATWPATWRKMKLVGDRKDSRNLSFREILSIVNFTRKCEWLWTSILESILHLWSDKN